MRSYEAMPMEPTTQRPRPGVSLGHGIAKADDWSPANQHINAMLDSDPQIDC